ncbi:MAG TPA: Crp/Fnr family transcriptional regulator [Roseomonas sp.]|nr:Crp/Fnr family transcriptional regulator [Roseomonas sp.]
MTLLRDAAPAELARLLGHARWRDTAPGELILDYGDPSDEVFFVVTGCVQVLLRTAEGKEFLFGEIREGGCFGEIAAIDGQARSANVTARAATRLCIVPGPAFLAVVLASSALCLALLRMMSARLRENGERLLEIATLPVRQRLAATLLRLARPRAGGAGEMVLSPPPTHQTLSVLIGARREAVTRELAAMAEAGLIETTRRAIIIRRADMLRQ